MRKWRIGNIADPDAQQAVSAGVGKQVKLTVGGKVDKFHGPPVAISGRVRISRIEPHRVH